MVGGWRGVCVVFRGDSVVVKGAFPPEGGALGGGVNSFPM